MNPMKENFENEELVKSILVANHIIEYCPCGSYYWKITDDKTAYATTFAKLKELKINMNSLFVKRKIQSIISVGGSISERCPHCDWVRK